MGLLSAIVKTLSGLGGTAQAETPDLGADFALDETSVKPAYDPVNSMSSATQFSWVYAVVMRRAAALSRLPIRVYRVRDGERELVEDHWFYDLLNHPNTFTPGRVFRRDMVVDYTLSGNTVTAILGPDVGRFVRPVSLVRWHPERVSLRTTRQGPSGYCYDLGDGELVFPLHRILHARQASTGDGANELFWGEGIVRPLQTELEAEWHAVKRAKEQMARGRPDVVISPKTGRQWDPKQREIVAARYKALTREGGGAIVAPDEAEIKILSWAMRDMEGQALRTYVREGILAVSRTPPVAAGLDTANFATAKEQDIKYWESLQDDGQLFDEVVWTELLRRAGEDDLVAETDYSSVRSLSAWRGEAAQRAQSLWMMGVDRDVALTAEGLSDVVSAQAAAPRPAEKPVEKPQEKPAESAGDQAAPESSAPRYSAAALWFRGYQPPPAVEADRAVLWQDWCRRVHTPHERQTALALSRHLKSQAARLALRFKEIASGRSEPGAKFDLEAMLLELWDEVAESAELRGVLDEPAREAARDAYQDAVRRLGATSLDIQWKSDEAESRAVQELASSVKDVDATTKAALRRCLEDGLAEGASIGEMQAAIQQAAAFSPGRALRVARTETTRCAKTGAIGAYRDARGEGIDCKKQWLAERDEATRPEHYVLDGQVADVDGLFTVKAGSNPHTGQAVAEQWIGQQADGPGGFASAALVTNCRCALVPVIEEAA